MKNFKYIYPILTGEVFMIDNRYKDGLVRKKNRFLKCNQKTLGIIKKNFDSWIEEDRLKFIRTMAST